MEIENTSECKPIIPCHNCKQKNWWWQQNNYNPKGKWVCSTCHPAPKLGVDKDKKVI